MHDEMLAQMPHFLSSYLRTRLQLIAILRLQQEEWPAHVVPSFLRLKEVFLASTNRNGQTFLPKEHA